MADSYFGDKKIMPTDQTLAEALKASSKRWDEAIQISGGSGEWKFYTKAAGWTYPVKQGKRTLFYMLPKDGWFRLTFVFGERATEAARTAGLPDQVLDNLLQSRAYVEGRSVALEVKTEADLETFRKLLQLKLM